MTFALKRCCSILLCATEVIAATCAHVGLLRNWLNYSKDNAICIVTKQFWRKCGWKFCFLNFTAQIAANLQNSCVYPTELPPNFGGYIGSILTFYITKTFFFVVLTFNIFSAYLFQMCFKNHLKSHSVNRSVEIWKPLQISDNLTFVRVYTKINLDR